MGRGGADGGGSRGRCAFLNALRSFARQGDFDCVRARVAIAQSTGGCGAGTCAGVARPALAAVNLVCY